jgi:hypothetical protein
MSSKQIRDEVRGRTRPRAAHCVPGNIGETHENITQVQPVAYYGRNFNPVRSRQELYLDARKHCRFDTHYSLF